MVTGRAAATSDQAARKVSGAGRDAGARARRAGAQVGDAVEDAADEGARRIRRGSRSAADAYDDVAGGVDRRVASIEDTIRENPLAAAGAALLVGLVLGRFIL